MFSWASCFDDLDICIQISIRFRITGMPDCWRFKLGLNSICHESTASGTTVSIPSENLRQHHCPPVSSSMMNRITPKYHWYNSFSYNNSLFPIYFLSLLIKGQQIILISYAINQALSLISFSSRKSFHNKLAIRSQHSNCSQFSISLFTLVSGHYPYILQKAHVHHLRLCCHFCYRPPSLPLGCHTCTSRVNLI